MGASPSKGRHPGQALRLGRAICVGVVGVVALIGGSSALLFLHADALLAAATDGVLIAVVIVGIQQSTFTQPRIGRAKLARHIAATVCTSAAGAVVVAGLFRIMGPFALVVLTVVVAMFVWLSRLPAASLAEHHRLLCWTLDSYLGAPDGRPPWGTRCIAELGGLSTLTDAQLCVIWDETLQPVRAAASTGEFERLVDIRRAVLDELERRDPDGFDRWLQDRPRTNNNPLRHVHDRPGGAH